MRCVLIIGVDLHEFSRCFLLEFAQCTSIIIIIVVVIIIIIIIIIVDGYLAHTSLLLQM